MIRDERHLNVQQLQTSLTPNWWKLERFFGSNVQKKKTTVKSWEKVKQGHSVVVEAATCPQCNQTALWFCQIFFSLSSSLSSSLSLLPSNIMGQPCLFGKSWNSTQACFTCFKTWFCFWLNVNFYQNTNAALFFDGSKMFGSLTMCSCFIRTLLILPERFRTCHLLKCVC